MAGGSFAGGTMLYNGATSPVNHTGLIANTMYYYKVWSFDGSFYSGGLSASATTLAVINPTLFAAKGSAPERSEISRVL